MLERNPNRQRTCSPRNLEPLGDAGRAPVPGFSADDFVFEKGGASPSSGEEQLPGAYVFRSDGQGTRLQETIDGVAYTGQRYEISVYPQRTGEITVPPLPLEVNVKTWGADASQTAQQRGTPALRINARLPPPHFGRCARIGSGRARVTGNCPRLYQR